MSRLLNGALVVGLLLPVLSFVGAGQGSAKPDAKNGCVSCHVVLPDGTDKRLNTAVKAIKGHPALAMVKVVPSDCGKCHGKGKVSKLSVALHRLHYEKGEKSAFLKELKGSCTSCHSLDAKTGKVSVKSGAKNW
jgi:nitrate/TMAO reductase-like tetraheme cytochrome c subunit